MAEVKRGYRKVVMVIPVSVYDQLTKLAEISYRDVGQQSAYYVQQALVEVQAGAIREAYREAVDRRDTAAELIPEALENGVINGPEDIELGESVDVQVGRSVE